MAYVGVPSFVVTLAGFLIWQGVILNQLEQRGTIIIQDRWINYTDSYAFSHFAGYLIALIITLLYPLSVLYKRVAARGTQIAAVNWTGFAVKTVGIGIAAFGTVAIANHGKVIATSLGLPLSGVIVIIFFILLTFLAKWTTFGRHVYAVGGNAEAARRAGINVPRIRVLVFMLSGATAGIGGIIFASQVNSVALTFPPGNLLLNAIASAVIGGVSLFGGRGEVRGALLGAILIGTLQNGLNTLNVSNGWIYIITGLVLLAAVTLDTIRFGCRRAPAARQQRSDQHGQGDRPHVDVPRRVRRRRERRGRRGVQLVRLVGRRRGGHGEHDGLGDDVPRLAPERRPPEEPDRRGRRHAHRSAHLRPRRRLGRPAPVGHSRVRCHPPRTRRLAAAQLDARVRHRRHRKRR